MVILKIKKKTAILIRDTVKVLINFQILFKAIYVKRKKISLEIYNLYYKQPSLTGNIMPNMKLKLIFIK